MSRSARRVRAALLPAIALAALGCDASQSAPFDCPPSCPAPSCVDGVCLPDGVVDAEPLDAMIDPRPVDAIVDDAPDAAALDAAAPDAEPDAAGPALYPLVTPIERARSLVWTDPLILDDPTRVSLARAMATAADDGHGGRLFDDLLRRFGTTAFSPRPDQAIIADELRAAQGDPAEWDLDQAPFIATAVHLRLDLAGPHGCGELRISFSTTHRSVQPFHLIFLFAMEPEPGEEGCYGLAVRLARLSELSEGGFHEAASALLDEHLVPERFLLIETAEFTIFPWEWRQWVRAPSPDPEAELPVVLTNPPLFQTVDVDGMNRAGQPLRGEFIGWVEENAAAINARTALIPEAFRGPIGTAPTAVPRRPLSLAGVDPAIARRYPDLRRNLELVGCPVCHTADADFVHTTPERTFSAFYEKELDARAAFMEAWVRTGEQPPVTFGPLQPDPVLPE